MGALVSSAVGPYVYAMSETTTRREVAGAAEKDLARSDHVTRSVPARSSGPPEPARFRTRCDPTPIPDPTDGHDLGRPEYYLNRELTWLNFNFRVLHEAQDRRTPLLERLKFLSIVGSNLDEFFMKRIGGLKQQVEAGITELTVDGRTPGEQIEQCYTVVRELEARQRATGAEILAALADEGIRVTSWQELSQAQRKWLRKHYVRNIYPLVTPQATDPAHPFPFISNLSLNLLVTLRYKGDEHTSKARVKVYPWARGFRVSSRSPNRGTGYRSRASWPTISTCSFPA